LNCSFGASVSTFVLPIGLGMGDVFISLPVIQSLINRGEEVYLVTRSYRQTGLSRRIVGIKGEVTEAFWQPEANDRVINLRAHPLQTDHNWASKEFAQFFGKPRIEKIIERISQDFGLATDYQNLSRLDYRPLPGLNNTVIFVPASDGFYKHWPRESWINLGQKLKADGLEVAILGELNQSRAVEELIAAGLPHLLTNTIDDAIDILSNCLVVAAVDTGLMHIAVQQGTPTCVFIHPQNIHHRSAANCFIFEGQKCPAHCQPKFVEKPDYAAASLMNVQLKFNRQYCTLSDQENCMAAIAPDAVLAKLRQQIIFARSLKKSKFLPQ